MPDYLSLGDVPSQRHTHHLDASGHRFAEELMGQEGFSSNSSLLYHRHSPSALTAIEPAEIALPEATADVPLTPRHIRTPALAVVPGADLVTGRTVLLANDDVEVAWVDATADSRLYRTATGDELVFVQHGLGRLDSVFGRLDVGPGDYVVVPASTTHRWLVTGDTGLGALVIASRGHVAPPAALLNVPFEKRPQLHGLGQRDQPDFRKPAAELVVDRLEPLGRLPVDRGAESLGLDQFLDHVPGRFGILPSTASEPHGGPLSR